MLLKTPEKIKNLKLNLNENKLLERNPFFLNTSEVSLGSGHVPRPRRVTVPNPRNKNHGSRNQGIKEPQYYNILKKNP